MDPKSTAVGGLCAFDALVGTTVLQFLDDVMMRRDTAWGYYRIPATQWDNMLVQLSLLHKCVRCIVQSDHDVNHEEEVSRCGVSPVWMPHQLTLHIVTVPWDL